MSIPVQYASFKSAGVYRIVYDRSTVLNQNAEVMRLVVGYSEKGPFNTPVYVKTVAEFKAWFGDISKKLEKRGDFFHRIALQALTSGPILAFNLKPFDDDLNRVDISSINTSWESTRLDGRMIDTDDYPVRDIYDRTKFWELDSDRLNTLLGDDGKYIHLAATDSEVNSASYFIRKASGTKSSGYNITVSDWYKSTNEEIPEYLEKYSNAKISDFFAEIYVFKGKFDRNQVQSSDTLRQYFDVKDDQLTLKPYVTNAFGDAIDTLDALYAEDLSSPIGHYVGCLIPEFKDKMGVYQSLDIIFNNDMDTHRLMMSFNDDLLWETGPDGLVGNVNINLSGNDVIFDELNDDPKGTKHTFIDAIFECTAYTTLLGNVKARVIADKLSVNSYGDIENTTLNGNDYIYKSSVDFLDIDNWSQVSVSDGVARWEGADETSYSSLLSSVLSNGDAIIGYVKDEEGETSYTSVFVQNSGTSYDSSLGKDIYFVEFTGCPVQYSESDGHNYIVRLDNPLNQEIGEMRPYYLKGYEYPQGKPEGHDMLSKLNWQNMILDTINDSGIHTALLSKSEIDYRYIIDGFDSYVDSGCKKRLSYLAKEKDSCFAILNFPAIRTFVKCPYASFVNDKGIFNAQYIVDGANKKKSSSLKFTLPGDGDGASYCAFYTTLKFSDGYIDSYVPSAGLVSNLYMEKYKSREPYYIIAGPNYAAMSASGLIGPDYNFSRDELNILEPYGVNCMVYRPGFGTFINANQTAKQTPKSALSSINVRELVIYLQDEIEKVLQSFQWEFNNPKNRQAIKDKADYICERVKANGGLQAYLNVMDESNNTDEIIDNEMAVLATSIEPGRGMGKMIHELTIYRSGQLKSMITEE